MNEATDAISTAERIREGIRKNRGALLALLCLAAGVAFVLPPSSPESIDTRIEMLRIGVLPGEARPALEWQFSPLVEYLEQEIELPCRLFLHDSYEALQLAFEREELDLAWFGGFTFTNAKRTRGAIPLVSRDLDLRFVSYFLVRPDEPAAGLADFRGKRFAFGSRLSTSGHLMPRHFLESWEIDPDSFFGEVRYTGAHDKTAFAVRDGEVDIGVASGPAVESMLAAGRLDPEDVRILKETQPYLDYVWACQASLPDALRNKLRDAFMNLTTADPEQAEILHRLRARYFLPVHRDEFRDLERIIEELGLVVKAQ